MNIENVINYVSSRSDKLNDAKIKGFKTLLGAIRGHQNLLPNDNVHFYFKTSKLHYQLLLTFAKESLRNNNKLNELSQSKLLTINLQDIASGKIVTCTIVQLEQLLSIVLYVYSIRDLMPRTSIENNEAFLRSFTKRIML